MADSERDDVPKWLSPFLVADYFTPCSNHAFGKNEKNYFCIECVEGPFCQMELQQEHMFHQTLQIRRASHVNAVRISDIHKLIDISEIQTYVINSAKIVFLLSRPQQKVVKGARYWCSTCGRTIADPLLYCSISCKLASSKSTLFSPKSSPHGDYDPHNLLPSDASDMTESFEPSTPIKGELQAPPKKRRIGRMNLRYEESMAASSASTQCPSWAMEFGSLRMRRRKGTPHRAPLM